MTRGRVAAPSSQEVRFCRAPDGVRIAYAVHGSGPPLLVSTCWLSHLQFDWESPVWRHFLVDLGRIATVIRFDERGHGLSDWDVTDHSLSARLGDLEAVADAAGFERFALMAMAQGGPVAIHYAARHPDRVTRLLFYDGYADPRLDATPQDLELEQTFEQLIRSGWARPESTFRRVFTSLMIPSATEEQKTWLDELMRFSVSASTAYESRRQRMQASATALLPDLRVPTLVLHALRDRMNEFRLGRHLAGSIPGARLVPLDSDNHILLADEPAWQQFVEEVGQFLAADAAPASPAPDLTAVLTPRERDVLSAAARGADNETIAAELVLSVRTVERHLQNVYAKLGLDGRTARAAAVAMLLRG
ncbi:MAG: alpha/beta fold hydrolase [Jatrophihabitans sp.]|uniref:alpha/beta fold hydrolase n=1 Tax=Jatrophihabitans sp. TaxID=1932789 RepID=UPI003F7D9CD4